MIEGFFVEGIMVIGAIILLLNRGSRGLLIVCVMALMGVIMWDKGVGDILVIDTLAREARVLIIILVIWAIGQERGKDGWMILMAGIGGIMIVGSGNILILYMSIELQALSIYVLLGLGDKRAEGLEGAIKYYIIGGLATGIMAYGWSLQYKSTGEISISGENVLKGADIGKVLVTLGLLVKIAAAPLHMWSPDVYEGARIVIVGVLSTIGKIGIIVAMLHIGPISNVVMISSVLSLVYGGLGALNQVKIKRLLAYSGIVHIGYILLGISIGSYEGMQAMVVYMGIYAVTLVGVISLIKGRGKENIRDYIGMSVENKVLSISFGVLLLSLAGMPPFLGFLGKWLVIAAIVGTGNWLIGVLAGGITIVNIVYYARIMHMQYFNIKGWEIMVIQRVIEGISGVSNKEGYWIGGALYMGLIGIWLPTIWLYVGNIGVLGLY